MSLIIAGKIPYALSRTEREQVQKCLCFLGKIFFLYPLKKADLLEYKNFLYSFEKTNLLK